MRQECDPSGSGFFDEPSAHALLERRQLVIEEADVIAAFKVFDDAGTGKIKLGALKDVLTTMGEKFTDEEWNKFAAVADPKCDRRRRLCSVRKEHLESLGSGGEANVYPHFKNTWNHFQKSFFCSLFPGSSPITNYSFNFFLL